MPYRKIKSTKSSPETICEDLIETPVYIKPSKYGAITHRLSQPTFEYEPHLIKANEITPGICRKEYEDRRHRLFVKLPIDACLILASNPEPRFSHDAKHSFRQNSDFLYFTGLQEANSMAVFCKDAAANCKFILFVQERMTGRDLVNVGDRCGLSAAINVNFLLCCCRSFVCIYF